MHRRLFAALLFAPGCLFAQSTPEPAQKKIPVEVTKAEEKPDAETVKLDKVEVTGSRIRTLNGEATAIPVFSIPQVELEHRGVTRLADIRWAIPQLGGTTGFNDNLQNSGTSRAQSVSTSFNLRGLGGNSTLVLIDGRRIPHTGQEAPGGAGGREDYNIDGIPVSAIERIDILPSGAGAVYGAEAIAGVVNIVLKKNYSGAELSVTYDNTFSTDVAQTTVALTAGYRSGKLSTFLTASYETQNALMARDRWFSATYDNRVFGSTSTSFLSNVSAGSGTLSTAFSPASSTGANIPGLTTYVVGIPSGSTGTTVANGGYTLTPPVPFDAAPYATSIDPAKRKSVVFKGDYTVAPYLVPYLEARWSRFDDTTTGTPITLTQSLPVGYAGNPFSVPVYVSKVFYDLPAGKTKSSQENEGLTLGVRGDFLEHWHYDADFSWARNIVSDVPISSFGFDFTKLSAGMNNADPALRPILAYDSSKVTDPNPAGRLQGYLPLFDHKDTSDTTFYTIMADGPVWSGWAGDIQLAVGAEGSKEKVNFYRDPNNTYSYVLKEIFSRTTTAGFAETTVPLLSERQHFTGVHRLEVGAAVRTTDYSDIGKVTTPTYRALFQPVKWLSFRAARSYGFKPVRLYDLLGPVTVGTTTLTTSSNIHDNLRGGELVLGTFTRSFGGNPTLKPESSRSRTSGIVLDVPFIKGLSFSADNYKLEYTDRDGGPGTQVLFDFFPERVTRATATAADIAAGYPGKIVTWDATNINLAGVKTKGWDYRMSYQRRFEFGDIMATVAYSHPDVQITKSTPAAAPSTAFGYQPQRTSGSVFFEHNAWNVGLSVNHQTRYYINGLTSASYPAYIEYNPQASYNFGRDARFNDQNGPWYGHLLAGTKVTVTIINALNKEPDRIDAANGRVVMDPRLRRYILSLTKKF
jgi:iron complex outermembrane recepter protein